LGRAQTHQRDVNDTDARLWHPWLRINRVLRVMLHTRWSAEASAEVFIEFSKALALRSQIRRGSTGYQGRPDLDGGVRGDRVWMTCSCGAVLVRVVAFG
jgi:hypothetical protein